jgi:hypothetical protein
MDWPYSQNEDGESRIARDQQFKYIHIGLGFRIINIVGNDPLHAVG